MTDEKMLKDPVAIAKRLIETGEQWAEADYAASLLEETKGTLLAKIMKEQGDIPMNKAEMLAKADERYERHLGTMVHARAYATKCKVRYDAGRAFIDMARSHEATTRAEMGLR